ncbi:MAG: hypothetical protein M3N51_04255, partial [Actinomycetota bacterium]|nr:hypothetical protein [Actinomycetota bacterium]
SESEVYGPQRRRILDRLEGEHDNLQAALDWALGQGDAQTALRLVGALWRFWQMRGYLREGRRFAERALALPEADRHLQARLMALGAAGGIAHWQMDQEGQLDHYREALALARRLGDEAAIANALYDLSFPVYFGALLREDGKGLQLPPEDPNALDQARAMWAEGLGLYEAGGDRHGMAKILWFRGFDRAVMGDLAGAEEDLNFALAAFEDAEDVFMSAWAHYGLANVADIAGDYRAARSRFTETLRLFAEAGDTTGVVFQLELLAKLEATRGDPERAARLAGAATALRAESGTELISGFIGIPLPEDLIRDDSTAAEWEEGKAMRREEAVTYALEEVTAPAS